jgi:hypothetical protein
MSKLIVSNPAVTLALGTWGYITGYVEANCSGLVPERVALYRFGIPQRKSEVSHDIVFSSTDKLFKLEAGPRLIQTGNDVRIVSSSLGDDCDVWLRSRRYGLENRYDYYDLSNYVAFVSWLRSFN